MPRRGSILSLLLLTFAVGCRSAAPPSPVVAAADPVAPSLAAPAAVQPAKDERLTSVLWLQTSAEYRALAWSAFAQARRALDRALADPTWTAALEQGGDAAALPPAVIADVDETLLDNSAYEAESILAGATFDSERWRAWIERRAALPVPGAVEFARYAAERGVTLFYVTNRAAPEELATRENLARWGFPLRDDVDTLLAPGERPEWKSDKTSRRAEVARSHRVLLLLGDDLNDFVAGAWSTPEERAALAERHLARWGERWILLPNPYYGSWERALYGHERGLPADEKARRKLEHLRLGGD